MATTVFDRKATIQALKKGEATPEQQRDAACLLLMLNQYSPTFWDEIEGLYLSLKGSGLAGEYAQKDAPPLPIPGDGMPRSGV